MTGSTDTPGRHSRRIFLGMSLAALPVAASLTACHGKPTTSVDAIPLDGFTTAVLRQEGTAELTLGKLSDFLETSRDDSDALAAMFSGLGADGTLALTEAVGNHVGLAYRTSVSESEMAQTTLAQLKDALETATKQWEPDYAQQFGSDLVEKAQFPNPDSPYYQLGNRNESLAYLLYDSHADNAFILAAAEKIDERQQEAKSNSTANPWTWLTPSRFLPSMVDEADTELALDIPSGIMHDLGDHPSASYQFFTGDGRVEYWAGQHPYQLSDLSGIAAALDSASTNPLLTHDHKQEMASIAARGLETLTGRDDFGVESSQRGVEGAQSLEHILETYMDALEATYANSHGSSNTPTYTATTPTGQELPDSPWFSEETLDAVLGVVGRDGQALIDLRTAVNDAETNSLPPGSDESDIIQVADAWGSTEGGIANAIGTGGIRWETDPDYRYAQLWINLAGKSNSELIWLTQQCISNTADNAGGGNSRTLIDHLKEDTDSWWNSDDNDDKKRRNVSYAAYHSYRRRLLWVADAAGLNGYQDPSSDLELNGDSIATVQNPDGNYRLITPDEYERLSYEDMQDANADLDSMGNSLVCMGIAGLNAEHSFIQNFRQRFS